MPENRRLYEPFAASACANKWQRIGTKRRAGVATPLFSIYSKQSIGIGEIPDLKLLIDWCQKTNLSIIQLLPMNDVGFSFRPYDAESCFALDAMYLSIDNLKPTRDGLGPYKKKIAALRKKFTTNKDRVDYRVKKEKLDLLREIYDSDKNTPAFENFIKTNEEWLKPYALFKVLKERFDGKGWQEWPEEFRRYDLNVLKELEKKEMPNLRFHYFLQWHLFQQFNVIKKYAAKKKVLLMGDLPFLFSRDSADVWSNQNYFKLHLSAGAPPDQLFAEGQKWGMPAYHWENIAADNYHYLRLKLKYAENFYDLFRIDHFVGLFRLWVFPDNGSPGFFDRPEEQVWEEHGRRILNEILNATTMMPCAEDLGTVPPCSYKVLKEFSIPGMDVQRWIKDWGKSESFLLPEQYRPNSIAVISTHDLSPLNAWWEVEAGTVDQVLFKRKCQSHGISFENIKESLFNIEESHYGRLRWKEEILSDEIFAQKLGRALHDVQDLAALYRSTWKEKEKFWHFLGLTGAADTKASTRMAQAALKKANEAASVFSIQLMQDWLSAGPWTQGDDWNFRINFPGTTSDENWSMRLPHSLELMMELPLNAIIRKLNETSGREI
jgi:4-alpha-glucanotransferase